MKLRLTGAIMAGRGTRVRKRKDNPNGFEEWGGYMNAKKDKLEKQFDSDQGGNSIGQYFWLEFWQGLFIYILPI